MSLRSETKVSAPVKPKLLIVDDDEAIRTQLKWTLGQEYSLLLAGDGSSALEIFKREGPTVVVLDLGLPPQPDDVAEGFKVLAGILQLDDLAKVIVSTGRGEKPHAMRALGEGAYDFLPKPVEVDELRMILRRAFYVSRLERDYRELNRTLGGQSFGGMLGTCAKMQEVFNTITKVAGTEASVLIVGENGTGKELAALAIHGRSARSGGPFVAINCGAIPENLLESELFGHEKGSFTGAHIQRKGRIELARGGTLFLDEIGDLSLALQVKFLRFLQERRIERVGGRESLDVDVRVLSATNQDLKQAMQEGRFREDLFYRLGVVVISIPPLRERDGDIMLMAQDFLRRCAAEAKKKITGFTPQSVKAIEDHAWPGNVRELENRIRRAVIMAEGTRVTPADLDLSSSFSKYEGMGIKEARESLEREFIKRSLQRNRNNITKAASELGISRPTMYEMMEKLGFIKEGE